MSNLGSLTPSKSSPGTPSTPRADVPGDQRAVVVLHPRPTAASAQVCTKCGSVASWNGGSWCPACGYYPKLNTTIACAVESPAEETSADTPSELPAWLTGVLFGSALLVLGSLAARFQVPADGPRTIVSLVLLVIGVMLAGASHLQAFMLGSGTTERLSMIDLVLAPVKVWRTVTARLPESGGLVMRGSWGVVAVLCALFAVGGIGAEEIEQFAAMQADQGPKMNLLQHAVGGAAKAAGGAKSPGGSIDDAVTAFAGQVGADQLSKASAAADEEGPAIRQECAIVGFTCSVNGNLQSVLVASMIEGQPKEFVAKLSVKDMPEGVANRFAELLPKLRVSRPSVSVPVQAYWVSPDLKCMIGYDKDESGELTDAQVMEVLGESGLGLSAEDVKSAVSDVDDVVNDKLPELEDALKR